MKCQVAIEVDLAIARVKKQALVEQTHNLKNVSSDRRFEMAVELNSLTTEIRTLKSILEI